jgi:hypothetical protein
MKNLFTYEKYFQKIMLLMEWSSQAHYSSLTLISSFVNNIDQTPTKHNTSVLTSMNRTQQNGSLQATRMNYKKGNDKQQKNTWING